MTKFWTGKTVFITGASAGIGLGLAQEFFRLGANVVALARREDRLQALAKELGTGTNRLLPVRGDVTRDEDLKGAVQKAIAEFGSIDAVIANAGYGCVGDVADVSIDRFQQQFDTNVFGVIRTVHATLDELKKSKGILTLIGSVAGYISLPGGAPYAMSKFAIHALASSLRHELSPAGVSVVLIAPGFVESEFRKVDNAGRFQSSAPDPIPHWLVMRTETAVKQIIGAMKSRRRERVVTGHGKLAVWIQRHFPALMHACLGLGLRSRR